MPKSYDDQVYALYDELLEIDQSHGYYTDIDRRVEWRKVYIVFPELDKPLRWNQAIELLQDCIDELK